MLNTYMARKSGLMIQMHPNHFAACWKTVIWWVGTFHKFVSAYCIIENERMNSEI